VSAQSLLTRLRTPRNKQRRRTAVVVIALVVVPLLVLAAGAVWFWWQLDPPGGAGGKVEVVIQRGWGVPKIGDELKHDGVIGSSLVFSVYARLNGDTNFKAGTYELHKHMGVRGAVKALKAGPRIDYTKLTIPPGLWLNEIAARVAKTGRDRDEFLQSSVNNAVRSPYEPDGVNSLEGLLWPDTYKISAEEDEIAVLKTMEQQFEKKAGALGLANANVQGHGAYDIIRVASLIEAEAKTDADRPLIASVIYNRLAGNMPLQVDATLIYARGDPAKREISDADKNINSPYNTYAHKGLPPTPIAAVSEASLRAALAPAQTTYLYYVVIDKKGDHAFASTLAEHNANIERAKAAGVIP
jgi:UPF0755 protein